MIFFHSVFAGDQCITLENTDFHSLIRVRRKKEKDTLFLVNIQKKSNTLSCPYFKYTITRITKKYATLEKISETQYPWFIGNIHLYWGICDTKTITTALPMLNQLGVEKITFVRCQRTQGNIKLSQKFWEKCNTILRSSCEQTGRNTLMDLSEISFQDYITQVKHHKNNAYVCDFTGSLFSENEIKKIRELKTIPNTNISHTQEYSFLIGPEGGFSPEEITTLQTLQENNIVSIRKFNTPLVLKSENACILVSALFSI